MGGSIHSYGTEAGPRWYISLYWRGSQIKVYRRPDTLEKFESRAQVEKWLAKARVEIDQGQFDPKLWKPESPVLVRNAGPEWLATKDASKKTLTGYRTAMTRYIIPSMGDQDVRHLRAGDIRKLKLDLERGGMAPKGVYNTISALKTFLRDLYRDEIISRVPPFPRLSVPAKPIQYLTQVQQRMLLEAIPERHRPIFAFGMEYGLRTQEVRALQKSAFRDGGFYVEAAFQENSLGSTKTGGVRFYEITEGAGRILEAVGPHLGPYVFVRANGKPHSNKSINRIWHIAENVVGIRCKLQNAFRHSLGCQLLDAGASMDLIKDALGHTTTRMTERYAQRSVTRITEALENRTRVIKFQNLPNRKNNKV